MGAQACVVYFGESGMTLGQRDKKVLWHPYTQHQIADTPLAIKQGVGAYLIDENGKRYLDLISSWWINLHGHCHPDISHAIYQQSNQLEHVIFSGFTHEPAITLAEKLLALFNNKFQKVFYSDNGSTSVEIALKMAYQYWRNKGQLERTQFLSFNNSFHGETFGSMSVGKKSGFFAPFEELLFNVHCFPYPDTWLGDLDVEQKEKIILKEISRYLEKHGSQIAALIIEPLVQGASGMHMCRPEFLRELEVILRSYGILIIYDEVLTGFGRIGTELFACQKAETTPDIICLAKGLTGGFLPLAATLCCEEIYNSFLGEDFSKALAHGHSFTANPLGCAAALASLTLLTSDETQKSIKMIEQTHKTILAELQEDSLPIEKLRFCGTIAAFDLRFSTNYGSNMSVQLRKRFSDRGLLIRPLGSVIYLLPPYCVNKQELKCAYEGIAQELQGITA
jgi:adenosylmethionine-8-amino-7-oxononanoate aminotransferase